MAVLDAVLTGRRGSTRYVMFMANRIPRRLREGWCAWLQAQGIDPARVLITNENLTVDEAEGLITYTTWATDRRGRPQTCDGEIVRCQRTVVAKDASLPFPSNRTLL